MLYLLTLHLELAQFTIFCFMMLNTHISRNSFFFFSWKFFVLAGRGWTGFTSCPSGNYSGIEITDVCPRLLHRFIICVEQPLVNIVQNWIFDWSRDLSFVVGYYMYIERKYIDFAVGWLFLLDWIFIVETTNAYEREKKRPMHVKER